MAQRLTIKAKPRENKKPNALRRSGSIPATIYGHSFGPKSIQVNTKEFSKIPYRAYSHLNILEIEGEEPHDILIKDVQIDPIGEKFLNIEFYRITRGEKVKIKVSLKFTGHSQAVTEGGVLLVSHDELDVQCLPKDIPDEIEVNLEEIKEIGQSILVKELKVPPGVIVLNHPDEVIAKVEIPKTHEVEEVAAPVEGEAAVPVEGALPAEGAAAPASGKEAAKAPAAKEEPKAKGKQEPKK